MLRRMTTVTIHEAKTHLSRLIASVEAGEEVIVSRGRVPVVRIVPLQAKPAKRRQLGWLAHEKPQGSKGILDDGFWDPLTDEEMGLGPDPLLDPK
jgi:prevent-host-death family protein